jgi:transposase-like protein
MKRQSAGKTRRKTSDEMYPLVKMFNESAQSMEQFCQDHGISMHVFNYWRSKYNIQARPKKSSFVALEVSNTKERLPQSNRVMKISYPNGVVIELPIF